MARRKQLLLVAAEASSDAIAARMAGALRDANCELVAAGRGKLAAAGARIIINTAGLGQVGKLAVAACIVQWVAKGLAVGAWMLLRRPAAVVAVSSDVFSRCLLGGFARWAGVYRMWVSPGGDYVRDFRPGKKVLGAADAFVCFFPWQYEGFKASGAKAFLVPHPAVLRNREAPADAESARHLLGLPQAGTVVGVLPGSRTDEVESILSRALQALEGLGDGRGDIHVLVSRAPGVPSGLIARLLGESPVTAHVTDAPVATLAKAADAAIVCSGTATTEVAVAGCPQVVAYVPSSALAREVQRRRQKYALKWVSLINVGLEREAVRELLHSECTPEAIAREVRRLLTDRRAAEEMREAYDEYRTLIGGGSWEDVIEDLQSRCS
jgi:lipid-A-disaccharide synthase